MGARRLRPQSVLPSAHVPTQAGLDASRMALAHRTGEMRGRSSAGVRDVRRKIAPRDAGEHAQEIEIVVRVPPHARRFFVVAIPMKLRSGPPFPRAVFAQQRATRAPF
eukprot:SAG31_NODE_173_length_21354_cov_16.826112_12_plen_108_part_00